MFDPRLYRLLLLASLPPSPTKLLRRLSAASWWLFMIRSFCALLAPTYSILRLYLNEGLQKERQRGLCIRCDKLGMFVFASSIASATRDFGVSPAFGSTQELHNLGRFGICSNIHPLKSLASEMCCKSQNLSGLAFMIDRVDFKSNLQKLEYFTCTRGTIRLGSRMPLDCFQDVKIIPI
jgi:hypothetical protein